MPISRRRFLACTLGIASAALSPAADPAAAASRPRVRAVAFDALAVFDARPVLALTERLFEERGAELGRVWRTRQFEYCWLRTLMNRYVDFWAVTEEALVHAAGSLGLELTAEKRRQLMQAHLELGAWPDVVPTLAALRARELRLALLSNFTGAMLDACVANSGLKDAFEFSLSTDRVRAYKPDPRAYAMATDAFACERSEVAFVAFGGWDAAGAKSFGFETFWVNRGATVEEKLGISPDVTGYDLRGLENFLVGR